MTGWEFHYLNCFFLLLRSSAYDTHDIDNPHHRSQSPEEEDDCCHLRVSQREAAQRHQMGHQVEGRSDLPGDSQPERNRDRPEQLRVDTEPRDPQAEADVHRDLQKWKDHRQRGAERAV